MLLKDKIAIVTGAGQGIGAATARLLSEAGATVVTADIDGKLAEAGAQALQSHQRPALALQTDVGSVESIQSMVDRTMAAFGRIDILVNNAGLVVNTPVTELDPELFERIVRSHLFGAFYCTRHACNLMREQGWGRIVNLVSRAGLMGAAGSTAYGSGKGGMYGLTNATARDLAPYGITVNAVNPAATRTRMVTDAIDRAKAAGQDTSSAERMVAQMQEPEDVAVLIAYLCTDDAADVNGQTLIAWHGAVGLVPTFAATRTLAKGGRWTVAELATSFGRLEVEPLPMLY